MVGQGRVDPVCPETSALLHMVRIYLTVGNTFSGVAFSVFFD